MSSPISRPSRTPLVITSLLASTAFFLFLALGYVPRAAAEDNCDLITDKDDREKCEKLTKKIDAYNDLIELKQKQQSTLNTQIQSLDSQASRLEKEIATNQSEIASLDSQIQALTAKIAEKERVIITQRSLLIELVRSYQENQGSVDFAPILGAADAKAALRGADWTIDTGGKLAELLDTIQELRDSLTAEKVVLDDKKVRADSLRLQLEQRDAYLDATKRSKVSLVAQAQKEEQKYSNIVDDLEREREEIEQEIEGVESGKISSLNLKDVPKFKRGLLGWPLKKITITQGYGKTRFTRWYTFHNGVDFAAPTGTSVLAAGDGKVVAIGNNGKYAYGRYIAIDHGNGLVTMYGHLSAATAKLGSKVKKGDAIARSGNTGYSTGPHVHFTVFATKSFEIVKSKTIASVKDIPVGATLDPRKYLP